ncbi:Putative glycosyltransferase EpsF [Corynebacterium comes]|uniref:Glycosyltransferase EpsF n=2 Tax=Corynebacterium comes TaxID=2675218 RepID=A0A6B8VUX7_9CORY|nr:Putative glycosyltransferase EpsF [Corynebacterium comes]
MLYNVTRYGNSKSGFRHVVVSLGEGDHFIPLLRELDIEVVELRVRKSPIKTLREFNRIVRNSNVICSWSYHSNLLTIWPKFLYRPRLVWIINHQDTARKTNKLTTWLIMKMCATLSRSVDSIAYNGAAALKSHSHLGYRAREESVVPNGCDTKLYSPAAASRNYLNEVIGERLEGALTILSAARWHPIKDHATFIQAFAKVKRKSNERVVAVLCGPGVDDENVQLVDSLEGEDLEIGKDVFLLGSRNDLPQLMAICSLFVLHSKAEAFPNVLVQAMSSGAKIVSTDVGIVSELTNGAINPVPPNDPYALAREMLDQLNSLKPQRDLLGRDLRQIITDDYSITSVVSLYEKSIFGDAAE